MRITDILVEVTEWDEAPIPVTDARGSIGGTIRLGVVRVRTNEGLEGNGFVGPLDLELSGAVGKGAMKTLTKAAPFNFITVPLHPGAERFWKEQGVTIPASLKSK